MDTLENAFIDSLSEDVLYIVNNDIATLAGKIRKEQRINNSRSVTTPDALIIATAIHNDIPLLTNDNGMKFAEEYGIHVYTIN